MNGVLRFSLVKQRNGQKYTVKKVKVDKDYSFRDNIASLVLKVYIDNFDSVCIFIFQSIQNGTTPRVVLPIGQNLPSVRPIVEKPDKEIAIAKHQSRCL